MSRLLPDRHPTKDFFVLDVRDASPKDDIASMEHPIFSLSVKPDMRNLEYENNGRKIVIRPSAIGLATIMDKDIILYCISKLIHLQDQGVKVDPWIEITAHEVMVATNWNIGSKDYKRFEDSLLRLRQTTIITNIETGNVEHIGGFGIIDAFEVERVDEKGKRGSFGRMSKVRIKLSDWTMNAVKAGEVLSISPLYFRLRRPLERRIYELARKHVGNQNIVWECGLEKFQKKVGSSAPKKKFRFFMKEIIADGNIPDYEFELAGDKVLIKKVPKFLAIGKVRLKPETIDRAQAMAHEKGLDFPALEAEWQDMITRLGKPDSPDGAFIGYIKKKPSARRGDQGDLF